MLRMIRQFMTVAVAISFVGGSLAFAQGTSGTMPDKAMSPPSTMGAPGKAGMPMDKGSLDKPGMSSGTMGLDKPGMSMDKPGTGMGKAGMAASKATTATGPVDINTADEASLKSLKGIGPTKAKAIVAYRQQNGPFKSVDELDKVPGIGKKTMASLKDKLTIGKGL